MIRTLLFVGLLCSLAASCYEPPEPSFADGGDRLGPPLDTPDCGAPRSVTDGQPCTCDRECAEGATCVSEQETGVPRGRCERLCLSHTDCGSDALCNQPDPSRHGLCIAVCATNEQCGAGRLCDRTWSGCLPWCQSDDHCNSGLCNLWSGQCEPDRTSPPDQIALNEPCLRHEDCYSTYCVAGHCRTFCSRTDVRCPARGLCSPIEELASSDEVMGFCVAPCVSQSDCSHDLICDTIPATGTACFPPIFP